MSKTGNGFYSPKDKLDLWNGPGYPIVLLPFVLLKTPLIFITLFNAFLQYFSVVILFKCIKQIANIKFAFAVSFIWASYYISYQELPVILTEPLTSFLNISIVYFAIQLYHTGTLKYRILAGVALGFLALTKIIFGYVILFCLIIYAFGHIMIKKYSFKVELTVLLISMATLAPYLVYTYQLTGKFFYLGNSGGMSLYFMSTPFEEEYGDWNNESFTANCKWGGVQPCNSEYFLKNHKEPLEYILSAEGVERDERYKEIAIRNIMNNPVKFLKNCIANQGRLWFGFPNSYFFQRVSTLFRVFPNAILFTAFCYAIIYWLLNLKLIRRDLNFISILMLIYLGGSTLVSAYPRQLYVIVPAMLTLIAYVIYQSVTVSLIKNSD